MESYNSVVQEKQSELVLVDRHINIDSRDRNKTIFSNTNEYDINLREALFSVKKIELVSAEIPKSEYFVDGIFSSAHRGVLNFESPNNLTLSGKSSTKKTFIFSIRLLRSLTYRASF